MKTKSQEFSDEVFNKVNRYVLDENLLGKISDQSLPNYMHTTKEVLKFLQWHKRIADILIEGTVDDSGGD